MVSVHLFCFRDVVEAIVDSDDWVEALRHTYSDNKDGAKPSDKDPLARVNPEQSIHLSRGEVHLLRNREHGEENEPGGYALTPLRMMILKMPGDLIHSCLDHWIN